MKAMLLRASVRLRDRILHTPQRSTCLELLVPVSTLHAMQRRDPAPEFEPCLGTYISFKRATAYSHFHNPQSTTYSEVLISVNAVLALAFTPMLRYDNSSSS